jgi:hypothetical protein
MMPTLLRVSRLARVHLSEECVPVLGTAAPGVGRSNAEHGDTISVTKSGTLATESDQQCEGNGRVLEWWKEKGRALLG